MSKFSPWEFFESVRYYSENSSPIDACKEDVGVSSAWLHHKGRNKHHYEYWQDNFDDGTVHLLMPFKYNLEMLCDYLGAGRAYQGETFSFRNEKSWWENKKQTVTAMHPINKKFLDAMIERLNDELHPEIWRSPSFWYDFAEDLYYDIVSDYNNIGVVSDESAITRDFGDDFLKSLEEQENENKNDT